MANLEYINQLCRGVDEWNKYRASVSAYPDLTHIDIRGMKLRGAQLQGVDFDGSELTNIDLTGADLTNARLNGVRAERCLFNKTKAFNVELKGSDFTRVSFDEAQFNSAAAYLLKIRHSNLRNASFFEAKISNSHIYNSDIHGVCFRDASFFDFSIKRASLDDEQINFLQKMGCKTELNNMPNRHEWLDWNCCIEDNEDYDLGIIIHKGRTYWVAEGRYDFFISHATSDKNDIARPLAEALRKRGQRIWYDEHYIRAGNNIGDVIEFGIKSSVFGIVIISKNFFGRKWTEVELDMLMKKKIFLVLHQFTAEDLYTLRPALVERYAIPAIVGVERIAEQLIEAIRQAPRS